MIDRSDNKLHAVTSTVHPVPLRVTITFEVESAMTDPNIKSTLILNEICSINIYYKSYFNLEIKEVIMGLFLWNFLFPDRSDKTISFHYNGIPIKWSVELEGFDFHISTGQIERL